MTAHPPSDPRITFFVDRYVTTLDDLECLLLLIQTPERWWDAESIARELHVEVGYARHALERFAAGNLLAIRITGAVRYQYQPGDEALAAAARAFAEAARMNRLEMIKLVTERTSRNIRDFAKAFRIRRDHDS